MKNYIEKNALLTKEDACLAAVSGGADSMCMLALLDEYCKQAGIRLGVVSVNHGFRPEAKEEAAYVEEFCKSRGIPFFLKEIKPGECEPTEEAARIFRYRLIREAAQEGGYTRIALAHNACDKAETMLFNLFRGTGITGLVGIRAKRDEFIRPILFMKRDEIEAYLEKKSIWYYTDSTNLEDEYSRNRIRHHILPQALGINTESVSHMNEAADYLAEIAEYVDRQTGQIFDEIVYRADDGTCVDVDKFTELDKVIQSGLARRMLLDMTPKLKDITAEHITAMIELAHREDNGRIDLPYGIRVYREYGRIRATNIHGACEDSNMKAVEINLEELRKSGDSEPVSYRFGDKVTSFRILDAKDYGDYEKLLDSVPRNKYTKWFDCDKISKSMELRARRDKDYLIVDSEGHHKSVNRCLIDLKIPEALRDKEIVLANGEEIIWIVGRRESFSYRIDSKTRYILEINLLED